MRALSFSQTKEGKSVNNSIHNGHRQRMKEKVMNNRSKQMMEHELLEVLLYYVQPRKNTNEVAHLLLQQFGTLKNIFNADAKDLMLVKGVSEHTTAFLKLFTELFDSYNQTLRVPLMNVSTTRNLKRYIEPFIINALDEMLYIIYIDEKFDAFAYDFITKGDATQIDTCMDEILTLVQRKSAKYVALAHNHPYGDCVPSQADITSTIKVKFMLKILGVELIDHIVFGVDGYCAIMGIVNDEYDKLMNTLDEHAKSCVNTYILPKHNDI